VNEHGLGGGDGEDLESVEDEGKIGPDLGKRRRSREELEKGIECLTRKVPQ